jgi:hypothetical protein
LKRIAVISSALAAAGVAALALMLALSPVAARAQTPAHQSGPALRAQHIMHVFSKGTQPNRVRRTNNLNYHGGVGGVGVETGADRVYLVYW